MNILSLIVSGLLGLLLLLFSVLLMAAIIFNLNLGKRYRRHLAQELARLRLSKMLSALGIDTNAYLHSERVVDVQKQMKRCSECARTAECDDRLSAGEIDPDGIEFCNNEKSLLEILDKEKTATSGER